MPIRPENRARYPDDWPDISRRIRFDRAGGRCECTGECGMAGHALATAATGEARCSNRHGLPTIYGDRTAIVVLTTAHLDHTPENCEDENLRAMCQGCHLYYDQEHHAATRAATATARREAHGLLPMIDLEL